MTRARKFIAHFHASDDETGVITTIEPALMQHIEAVLNSDYPHLIASLTNVTAIDRETLQRWEAEPLFDEDDLDRADNIITIKICRG
ncbi:hypothetical protein KW459_15530 [Vibrio fluvialis]|nr:hypothetical protein [Vibrio fluvialis]